MPSKLLELLAIDDEVSPVLTTDLIKIVEVADGLGQGGKADRVSSWLQHVHLLGAQQARVAFDLLFIDVRFENDESAPPYEGKVNPLGLLHALTFAARQDPSSPPYVWGYYSGNPTSAMKDPLAIIAFGLLSALEQRGAAGDVRVAGRRWKWDDIGLHNTTCRDAAIEHFSNAIGSLPKGGPDTIWKEMIRRYRHKLLHHLKTDRLSVEYDDLELAFQLAHSGTEKARKKLAEACIRISGSKSERSWVRVLLLQSLFADELVNHREEWPADDGLALLKQFTIDLKKASVSEPTEYWVAELEGIWKQPFSFLNGIRSKRYKKRLGTLAILCWWIEQKKQRIPASDIMVKTLLTSFGYFDNSKPLTNCLDIVGFDFLETFLTYLENTPDFLESPFYEVGKYWWETKCGCQPERAPLCIR